MFVVGLFSACKLLYMDVICLLTTLYEKNWLAIFVWSYLVEYFMYDLYPF